MTKTIPAWQAELERIAIKNDGCLNPEKVVQAARSKTSPLHSKFTWDDSEAAHQYRLEEARRLIRVVVHMVPNTKITERVFVSLSSDRGESGYRTLVSVLNDDEMRVQLLEEAKMEFTIFRQKYSRLVELSKVFAAMDEID